MLEPLEFVARSDVDEELHSMYNNVLSNGAFLEDFARALRISNLTKTHGLMLLGHARHLDSGSTLEQPDSAEPRRLIVTPAGGVRASNERAVTFRFPTEGVLEEDACWHCNHCSKH